MPFISDHVKKLHERFRGAAGSHIIQDQQRSFDDLFEEVFCRAVLGVLCLPFHFQVSLIPEGVVIPGVIEPAKYRLSRERLPVAVLARDEEEASWVSHEVIHVLHVCIGLFVYVLDTRVFGLFRIFRRGGYRLGFRGYPWFAYLGQLSRQQIGKLFCFRLSRLHGQTIL